MNQNIADAASDAWQAENNLNVSAQRREVCKNTKQLICLSTPLKSQNHAKEWRKYQTALSHAKHF